VNVISQTQINLSWQDNAQNEVGYRVYKKKMGEANFSVEANGLAPNTQSYQVKNLLSQTSYTFYVEAYNSAGNSPPSSQITATTQSAPPMVQVDMSKDLGAVMLNQSIEGDIKISNNGDGPLLISGITRVNGSTEFTIVNFPTTIPAKTYNLNIRVKFTPNPSLPVQQLRTAQFEVQSNDTAKPRFTISASSLPIVQPPAAPSNLRAQAISKDSIQLMWDDNSNNETAFRIERKTAAGNFVPLGMVGANIKSFTDIGGQLQPNTTYIYRIKAVNTSTNLESGYSNEASATTPAQ
jgi:titin